MEVSVDTRYYLFGIVYLSIPNGVFMISKEGANFLWPLVLIEWGPDQLKTNLCQKDLFGAKEVHGPM